MKKEGRKEGRYLEVKRGEEETGGCARQSGAVPYGGRRKMGRRKKEERRKKGRRKEEERMKKDVRKEVKRRKKG